MLATTAIILVAGLGLLGLASWMSFAVTVRRWHDRDKSWVWALLGFVPIIGWMWQGIECAYLEGTLGPNRYGRSPKGIARVIYESSLSTATA